jgi:hypothetical protein
MTILVRLSALVLLGTASVASCSSDTKPAVGQKDAARDGGAGTTCGGTPCSLPEGAGIERIATCCTDDGKCGLKLPFASQCLPANLPSQPNAACASFQPDGGNPLVGCCGQTGCGALDPFVGCVPNDALGRAAVSCKYDPNNDCTTVAAIVCDGAEDCPSGQHCCGRFSNSDYVQFGCFDACSNAPTNGADQWLELCHAGDTCEGTGNTCKLSQYLPAPLSRCFSMGTDAPAGANAEAGKVNCGSNLCGTGEKCCLRKPHDPYCAPASADCECKPNLDAAP